MNSGSVSDYPSKCSELINEVLDRPSMYYQSLGELDASMLQEIVQAVEKRDGATLMTERRDAMDLIQKVITITKESLGGENVEG